MVKPCWSAPGWRRTFLWVLLVLGLLRPLPIRAGSDSWKFDVIHLKNGHLVQGLIKTESPASITLVVVKHTSGQPTRRLCECKFQAFEIDRVDRLRPVERQAQVARLAEISPEGETQRTAKLHLDAVGWGAAAKGGLSY